MSVEHHPDGLLYQCLYFYATIQEPCRRVSPDLDKIARHLEKHHGYTKAERSYTVIRPKLTVLTLDDTRRLYPSTWRVDYKNGESAKAGQRGFVPAFKVRMPTPGKSATPLLPLSLAVAAATPAVQNMAPHQVPLAPAELGWYSYVPDLEKCVKHIPATLSRCPPVTIDKTIVFAMKKPDNWDDLDNAARWALKKDYLKTTYQPSMLCFEEDGEVTDSATTRVHIPEHDYYARFEVLERPDCATQFTASMILLELGSMVGLPAAPEIVTPPVVAPINTPVTAPIDTSTIPEAAVAAPVNTPTIPKPAVAAPINTPTITQPAVAAHVNTPAIPKPAVAAPVTTPIMTQPAVTAPFNTPKMTQPAVAAAESNTVVSATARPRVPPIKFVRTAHRDVATSVVTYARAAMYKKVKEGGVVKRKLCVKYTKRA